MNTALKGLVLVLTNSQPPKASVPGFVREMAVGSVGDILWAALLWAVLAVLTIVMLRRTTLGRVVYATGINSLATFFCGIDVRRTYLLGFVLSGLCGAIGGLPPTDYVSEAYLCMGNDLLLMPK